MLKNVTLSSAYQIWEADRSCMLSLDNRYQGLSAAHVGQIHVLVLRGKGIFLKKKITIEKLLKVFFKLLWLGSRPLPPSPPSWRRCSSQSWTLLSHRMRWRLQSSFGFSITTLNFTEVVGPFTFSQKVVLERPELPDLSKSGPPEPMDDTPPSPQVIRAIIP